MQRAVIYRIIGVPVAPLDEYLEREFIARGRKIVSVAPHSFKKSHMHIKIEPPGEGMSSTGAASFELSVDSWLIVYDDANETGSSG